MATTVEATFDGAVFRPAEPIELEPNTRVRLTVETESRPAGAPMSFLDTAKSLNLKGPPDWSARFHEYLYGTDAADGR